MYQNKKNFEIAFFQTLPPCSNPLLLIKRKNNTDATKVSVSFLKTDPNFNTNEPPF